MLGSFLVTGALVFAALLSATAAAAQWRGLPGPPPAHLETAGLVLAIASGALASGLGYTFWYAALPALSATRAAILQLAVPVLAAAAGIALLEEVLSPRLALAGAAILGGVALAIVAERPRRHLRKQVK